MNNQGMGEYYVDIVMCIDATGSMSPILNTVKENALSFYGKFVDAMEEADKTVEVLEIAEKWFESEKKSRQAMAEGMDPFEVYNKFGRF